MALLSSRANIGTHGAFYVYNYSDFRADPKRLLLKYFDVFFYIANWGTVQLKFKYHAHEVELDELKKFKTKDVISVTQKSGYVLLEIDINNEEFGGWVEGEGILPYLLPLYEELKKGNYQLLTLVSAINDEFNGDDSLEVVASQMKLSTAQKAFLKIAEFDGDYQFLD